ncbi:MAG: cytidine deaminase [Clostridiales Family XIII bacterium]|jgi:cytidine deaminase|nr:cytidine deaminase [Clostridiales Family XIII bacterium]
MNDKELYIKATAAAENAYAPYSDFRVGAAVLTMDGEVFLGANVENASYGATICAERVAIASAVAAGNRDFEAIAVTAPPCGICRQFIFEFGDNIRVITGPDADHLESETISALLPGGFHL